MGVDSRVTPKWFGSSSKKAFVGQFASEKKPLKLFVDYWNSYWWKGRLLLILKERVDRLAVEAHPDKTLRTGVYTSPADRYSPKEWYYVKKTV